MGEIIQKAMDTVEWPKSPTNSTKRKLCVRNYWDELYALLCFLTLRNVSPYIRQEGTHRYCRRIISIIYVCSYHRLHSLQWRHNGPDSISNHQPHDCLHNRVFRRRSKETSKLRVTGLCAGNSPETGEFPAQMASNAEKVSIWWRHHVVQGTVYIPREPRGWFVM